MRIVNKIICLVKLVGRVGLLSLILYLSSDIVNAQPKFSGKVLIKGRIINTTDSNLKFLFQDWVTPHLDSVSINKDGAFTITRTVDPNSQFVFFLKGQFHAIDVCPGDVLSFFYDVSKFRLLSISGNRKGGSASIRYDFLNLLAEGFHRDSILSSIRQQSTDDSSRYRLIQKFYQEEGTRLAQNKSRIGAAYGRYQADLYFGIINFMRLINLMNYDILTKGITPDKITQSLIADRTNPSKSLLLRSSKYRTFLVDRFTIISSPADTLYAKFGSTPKAAPWVEYQKSELIKDNYIRSWFIARSLIWAFQQYDITETEKVMQNFLKGPFDENFKKRVFDYWNLNYRLRIGSQASAFTLRDSSGNNVSLADFKGKVVYVNFWGVHCAPCLTEIKESLPQFYEKYSAKGLVILNICMDETEENWKKALSKIRVPGRNLVSKYGSRLGQDYNIVSAPHFLIIDREGIINELNAGGPSEFLSESINKLDLLLK